MLNADERYTSGIHYSEVARGAGLWLIWPDLSPLLCDRGCSLLRLAWRASPGHAEVPTIPDPVSVILFSFFSIAIHPDFNLCDYLPISGSSAGLPSGLTGSQDIITVRIYAFIMRVKNGRFRWTMRVVFRNWL